MHKVTFNQFTNGLLGTVVTYVFCQPNPTNPDSCGDYFYASTNTELHPTQQSSSMTWSETSCHDVIFMESLVCLHHYYPWTLSFICAVLSIPFLIPCHFSWSIIAFWVPSFLLDMHHSQLLLFSILNTKSHELFTSYLDFLTRTFQCPCPFRISITNLE